MIQFFFFHTLYGIAHLYLFLKIKGFFPMGTTGSIILGSFLAFMSFSAFLIYILSLRGHRPGVRVFAFVSYIWMGFLILFLPLSILLDLYNLGIQFSSFILPKDLSRIVLSPLSAFFIPASLSAALTTYGYFGAKNLRINRLTVKTSKLPEEIRKLTIAHLSDVHLGIIVRDEILDKVIEKIETEKPDLIVSTGDLVDGGIKQIQHLADKLRRINARLGKFAVVGNHEFYSGIKYSQRFLEDAGFTVLRGRGVTLQGLINIAGVDDSEGIAFKTNKNNVFESEREILSKFPSDMFTLLLKHKPAIDENALGLFDLQLSGHTHKGQIFPINLIVRLFFYPHSSYKNLSKGSAINVSGGVGTAGPPIRFLSPPEIAIIAVVSAKESQIQEKEGTDGSKNKQRHLISGRRRYNKAGDRCNSKCSQ